MTNSDDAPELAFLGTELGFQPPLSFWAGHDRVTEFVRDDVRVAISWDGAQLPLGAVQVGERRILTASLSSAEFAGVIRTHPEILNGEFAAMEDAELHAERRLRYAKHPELADIERSFREKHGKQAGVTDVICRLEPVREAGFAIYVMQTPGQRRPRLPKTFGDYKVYRLERNAHGFWMHDGPIR